MWKAQNGFIFDNYRSSPSLVKFQVLSMLQDLEVNIPEFSNSGASLLSYLFAQVTPLLPYFVMLLFPLCSNLLWAAFG